MVRHAVRFFSALLSCNLAALPALAGDAATPDIIGFSKDGRYFAFEEYGTRDASIHPYSTIFVIDLDTGKTVPGAPFAVEHDKEGPELAARAEARQQAEPLLARLGIDKKPTRQVVYEGARLFDPPTPDQAYATMAAEVTNLSIGDAVPGGDVTVDVLPRTITDATCAARGRDKLKSFSLVRTLPENNRDNVIVYVDEAAGHKRGCSQSNGLNALFVYRPANAKPRLVALVSYWPHSWEEPDRRHLAIPVPLP
ncbi:hypothetical protein C5L14_23765 [Labrys okinawensis]|uniref:DUF2259 domain-containing protein n=1 Tax=Labrys okinawensis TaxID=346911 RepID=A0A2S9Q6K5_9HYPH|nr:DUF2259 domain-containing protein [Labrys okinawensis]PRH84975.1 hypothetical protein C5L14_23765 [Labrys okinawensis]